MPVLPTLFSPEVRLGHSDMTMPDSDVYSAARPGNDPGETFAIREYVPGDAIGRIHWKLSEKTGKTMVREFGQPVVNQVLILLETAGAGTPSETDGITEVFASVCLSMIKAGVAYRAGWREPETDDLQMWSLNGEEDFAAMLEALLELPPKADGSVARRFTQELGHCGYAHVILVGGQIPEGAENLYNGNRVSLLLTAESGAGEGLQPDGTYVRLFDSKDYPSQLSRLEV